MAEEIDFKNLFNRIASGDKAAFDTFFRNSYPGLISFVSRYINSEEAAEELVSDVFVKLWLKRGSLSFIDNPKVYVYVAVKNAALSWLRQAAKQKFTALEEVAELGNFNGSDSPQSQLENKQLQIVLEQAISELPPQRRLIFRMVKQDGLKCREVAEILVLSVRTVEGQLFKAVKILADQLSEHLGYHPQTMKSSARKSLLSLLF